jgi:predicted Zn-dependent protease
MWTTRVGLAGLVLLLSQAAPAMPVIDTDPKLAFSSEEFVERGRELYRAKVADLQARGVFGGSPSFSARANRIFDRVVAAARTQGPAAAATPWELDLTAAPEETASAFASGQILLSEAFVEHLGLDDAEIAYVIGHEVSHLLLEHARAYATVALALLPHNVSRSLSDVYAEMNFNLGLDLRLAPFSVDAEFEADEAGLLIGALAGYPPAEMLGLFEKIERHSDHATGFMQTHGLDAERLDRARSGLPLAQRIYEQALRAPATP